MNFLDNEKVNKIMLGVVIILQIITISIVVLCSSCYSLENDESEREISLVEKDDNVLEENKVEEVLVSKVVVDIKGAVKKPGVYIMDSTNRVMDVVNAAGGLKTNASTKYINLSKKITDEMVINVYTTTQVKNMNKTEIEEECKCPELDFSTCENSAIIVPDDNNSVDDSSSVLDTKKISLNSATKEELMQLSGIGESKALAIIEYRTKNNGFKKIEDIMEVSGIGESAFNKIKDYITL